MAKETSYETFEHVYHKHTDHSAQNQYNEDKATNQNEKALTFQFASCVPTGHATEKHSATQLW